MRSGAVNSQTDKRLGIGLVVMGLWLELLNGTPKTSCVPGMVVAMPPNLYDPVLTTATKLIRCYKRRLPAGVLASG